MIALSLVGVLVSTIWIVTNFLSNIDEKHVIEGLVNNSTDIVVEEKMTAPYYEEGPLNAGASGEYFLDVRLDIEDTFHVKAEIEIQNESKDEWQDIGFYFVPNVFNEVQAGESTISSITVSGAEVPYDLSDNKLMLKLNDRLLPDEKVRVKITYSIKLSEEGIRLSRKGQNFYLAQWYPMLAHYQTGWEVHNYNSEGESYHTNYGKYEVSYNLPKEYLVVSSADDGDLQPSSKGVLKAENIKDFYLAFLHPPDWESKSVVVNDTILRVFLLQEQADLMDTVIDNAKEVYAFLEDQIGDNPFGELDVVGNQNQMEYPNVVEVSPTNEHVIVHEIVHQWFYLMVSNDPYEDGWLDEGLTEFIKSIYLLNKYEIDGLEYSTSLVENNTTSTFVNLSLDSFKEGEYVPTVYGKVPLLFREFFQTEETAGEALPFLAAYFKEYQFQHVNSLTFYTFFHEYFGEEHKVFLNKWLLLDASQR